MSSGRLLTIALGIWLVVSAFIWPHTAAQFTNAWIVGLSMILVGALSIRVDNARFACAALAAWLFFSNWILPTGAEVTAWNNILVSIAVFVSSLRREHSVTLERPAHA